MISTTFSNIEASGSINESISMATTVVSYLIVVYANLLN